MRGCAHDVLWSRVREHKTKQFPIYLVPGGQLIRCQDIVDEACGVFEVILTDASAYLNPSGVMLMEMDPRQIASATAFAAATFPSARLRVVRDLAGRERVLVLET